MVGKWVGMVGVTERGGVLWGVGVSRRSGFVGVDMDKF